MTVPSLYCSWSVMQKRLVRLNMSMFDPHMLSNQTTRFTRRLGRPTMHQGITRMNMTFAGCGFLGIYHLGVTSCLLKHGQALLSQVTCFAGASAGSLAAAMMVLGRDRLQYSLDFTYGVAAEIRDLPLGAFNPRFNMLEKLRHFLEEMLPSNAHELANHRLHIAVTRVRDSRGEIISTFNSREELILILLGSCFIPYYCGRDYPVFRGEKWLDGGWTDNLPRPQFGGPTITVSPFSGNHDICPQDNPGRNWHLHVANQSLRVNPANTRRGIHALKPPKQEVLEEYYTRGFQDMENYLKEKGYFDVETQNGLYVERETTV
ncbi:Patatin-like phospholipase domain-containing protein 4 [Branchiostoma belcheri]|nr:Patatin-like phospholipase domain-containing protein 4 [Branchiostoma belcheri]